VESEPERAEQISISGKVVDKSNEPIIGATVRVKGSKVGVSTDIDGNFVLNSLKTGDVIEISSIGYTTTTINVKNNSSVNVVLKDNYKALGEVVVVGYGTQKKVNLTGAVSVIKSEEITGRPTRH
jgi:hypothetical protein